MLDIAYTGLTLFLVALTFGMIRLFEKLQPTDDQARRD